MDTLKKIMKINNLIFASTDKNKKVLKKYIELWNEINNQIETTNGGESIN